MFVTLVLLEQSFNTLAVEILDLFIINYETFKMRVGQWSDQQSFMVFDNFLLRFAQY